MKILVTGANGLLGNAIFRLRSSEHQWVGTGRGERRPAVPEGVEYFSCDLENEAEVKKMMEQVQPDAVIHGAAMTQVDHCELDPAACRRANVDATKNLLDNLKPNTHFTFISTDFVFDGTAPKYVEDDEPNPVSVYGQSKLDAEKLVLEASNAHTILRTMLVYGYAPELSRTNIVLWVKSSLEEGKTIRVVDDQFRCPTLVDNLAEACILAVNKQVGGVFHISSDDYLDMHAFSCKIADYWMLDTSLIEKISTDSLGQPAKRPPRTGFILDKAKSELGFRPIGIDEGLGILAKRMENS
jgi:dTDP-4-dehydrorhamnose reductase